MKVLLTSLNAHEIHHLRNVLETEGIRCHIGNELLSRLAGEVPFTECAMTLAVMRDDDYERARSIVGEAGSGVVPDHGPWRCAVCGEAGDAQFTACWRCGAERPPEA